MGKKEVSSVRRNAAQEQEFKKIDRKIAIVALVIAVSIIALIGLGVLINYLANRGFDYMSEDLSEYIKLPEEIYKGFKTDLKFDEVGDAEVDRLINKLICQNKEKEPENEGASVMREAVEVGSVVEIFYRGYTFDKDGNEIEIENSSNLFGTPYKLEVGSGVFIPGFENALIGKIPDEYPRQLYQTFNGVVEEGQVVYISYRALYPDGKTGTSYSERIDLKSGDIDAKYGVGFKEFIIGKEIGEKLGEKIFKLAKGDVVYYDMTVEYVTERDPNTLSIEARFPLTYSEEDLRGKTVKFDVYFQSHVKYETDTYDEDFIKNVLKLTEKDLESYTGATLIEKHRSKLLSEAKAADEKNRSQIYENDIWEYLHSKVEIIKFPQSEVNEFYESEYNRIKQQYNMNPSGYSSVEEFARVYYRLGPTENLKVHMTAIAQKTVAEKMMFYHILRSERIIPRGDEFDRLYEETIKEQLEYHQTDDREELLDYYGEDYFVETTYYRVFLENMIKWTKENLK